MNSETGGPVFLVTREMIGANDTFNVVATEGMTLRDWFAGQALTGLLAEPLYDNTSTQKVICSEHGTMALNMAFASYALADAMLKARGG